MRRVALLFAAALYVISGVVTALRADDGGRGITRIAFGACLKQYMPQPVWGAINQFKPQLFIFLGDNVYAADNNMRSLREAYTQLNAQPGYAALRRYATVAATWDDHDYGVNDGGRDFALRAESQQAFADFLRLPLEHPLRRRPGVYRSMLFGPSGRRVQLILLDTRYFRDKLTHLRAPGKPGPYGPTSDPSATILGSEQWRWLEEQLAVEAELRLVVSSIQVISDQHGYESWGNMPEERKKLLRLLSQAPGRVIILSGDRHHSELSGLNRNSPDELIEITASSLNQYGGVIDDNQYRIGERYGEPNFGTIELHWGDPLQVQIAIRDLHGNERISLERPIEREESAPGGLTPGQ